MRIKFILISLVISLFAGIGIGCKSIDNKQSEESNDTTIIGFVTKNLSDPALSIVDSIDTSGNQYYLSLGYPYFVNILQDNGKDLSLIDLSKWAGDTLQLVGAFIQDPSEDDILNVMGPRIGSFKITKPIKE